jgi:hypothetical protein
MFSKLFTLLLLAPSTALAFTLITNNMKGWDKDEVKFFFNPADCDVSSGRIEEAIESAVNLWNGVPTSRLRVTYFGQTSDSGRAEDPIIQCVTSGLSGAVGVGTITTAGGVIDTGKIELNSEAGDPGDIAATTDDQLAIAVAHEMGHVFGLGHSTEESALMYYAIASKEHLTLSQDDIDGITWLYPRDEPGDGIFGCGSLHAGGGAGGEGPGGPLLWVLALAGLVGVGLRWKQTDSSVASA